MKSLKYWLSFLSLILLLVIPCGGFYYLSRQPGFNVVEFVKEYPMPVCIGAVIWAVLFKSCNLWYEKSKYGNNVDAFGMTSKLTILACQTKSEKNMINSEKKK